MKFNKSEIMKNAWNLVKNMGMTISAALKNAWASAKAPLKQLHVKEWFANKLCRELRRNLHSTEIFAVIKETEKAMYVMLKDVPAYNPCVWVPKSCIEECAGSCDFHTRFGLNIETATKEARLFWSAYC